MSNSLNAAKKIEELIQFGIKEHMMTSWDIQQVRNQIMDILSIKEPYTVEVIEKEVSNSPISILNELLDYAVSEGIINDNVTERDLLDSKLMAQLMPRQSELINTFNKIAQTESVKAATDYFYHLSQKSNYIRTNRIAKNLHWLTDTEYGTLEITINLSKPEKDPKEIAAEKNAVQVNYPKCLLCLENVGYAGRLNHPGRSNHRVIPVTLDNEQWYLQYSPYVYYNEHAIIFCKEHRPMKISKESFKRLLDFVEIYPHYFVGSNADLPIVGGSILSHDHFQGGRHVFPMEKAKIIKTFTNSNYPSTKLKMLKWSLSVIRLTSTDKMELVQLADKILKAWRNYSDKDVEIRAYTDDTPHNTITPIARVNSEGMYELDLTLRNNRTDKEHPLGIFHPHNHLHHIKKENIGLIEVMGLAVLPDRLKAEMTLIQKILTGSCSLEEGLQIEALKKHEEWIHELVRNFGIKLKQEEAEECIKETIGQKFSQVLECAGVYKQDEKGLAAFEKFIQLCCTL